ncbi:MAG: thiamine phosphate synthase, partial [Parvibaculales bacterium]
MSFMPHIFLVSSEQKGDPRPLLDSLRAGDGVVLRHYRDRHRSLLAGELAHLCHKKRLAFFIAGDWHLAYQHGAGLHLPQWQMARLGNLRQMAKKLNAPITIAAHGRASLLLGMKLGANA